MLVWCAALLGAYANSHVLGAIFGIVTVLVATRIIAEHLH